MTNAPQETNSSSTSAFLDTEYRVAADTYMHGVNIGYTVIRNFVALNAAFIGALGLANINSNSNASLDQINGFIKMIPIFAVLISLLLGVSFRYYKQHLDNCSKRCAQIEKIQSGQLFTAMDEIEKNKKGFSAQLGFYLIIIFFLIVWSVVGYHLKSLTVLGIS